jgi:hypothetical protein
LNESPRVFVCHAHADKALCTPYVAALRMLGLDLYYNPDDPQFGYLSSAVQDELRACKIMLALLTQDAIDSLWVKREMKMFVDLMKDDLSRELLLVPITPCSVQTGNQPRVTLIDASEISFDTAIDTIAGALGRPILTTGTPRAVRGASRGISRRALIGGGALAALAIAGGGTGWLLTHMLANPPASTSDGPDPGTPLLTWQPFGGKSVNFPLKFNVPLTTIDLLNLYRIDAPLGSFTFTTPGSNATNNGQPTPDLSCIVGDIPLVFGSEFQPGQYFVVTSKCFDTSNNAPSGTGPQPLDSLVVTYTFGQQDRAAPCATDGNGKRLCLPTARPAIASPVGGEDAKALLIAYYDAIGDGRYQDAYQLLSQAAQVRQTIDDFTQYWRIGPIKVREDFSAVGQNGDGSVALSLSYTQHLADGDYLWRATSIIQYENGSLHLMPLGRVYISTSTPTPTPAGTGTPT